MDLIINISLFAAAFLLVAFGVGMWWDVRRARKLREEDRAQRHLY